jgi:O-glycosyl hydrolase
MSKISESSPGATPHGHPQGGFSRRQVLKGALLSAFSLAPSQAQQAPETQQPPAVELAPQEPTAAARKQTFRFDSSIKKVQLWGLGEVYPRVYFDEFLPTLFDRTLEFDSFGLGDEGAGFDWIFTGERGGFTIRIEPTRLRVFERYYDSVGLVPLNERMPGARFPERLWSQATVEYQGELKTVQVTLDHQLKLAVALNGRRVFEQLCLLDVRRHQLSCDGKTARVEGALLEPEVQNATIQVFPSEARQTIIGFGGITTPTAYAMLSDEGKKRWWELLCEYNLLLHREYPMGTRLAESQANWDRIEDAIPHYYADNFPNSEVSNFEYLKSIRRIQGLVLFEFWQLPPWAKQAEWKDASGAAHAGVADPGPYARAMVEYCRVSRERTGAPPDIVGIQNEVTQPAAIWQEMTLRLRQELDRAGFDKVKIHMQDAPIVRQGLASAMAFQASPQVWQAIDFSAVHLYDYQNSFTNPDQFDSTLEQWHVLTKDKPFLATEICVNDSKYQAESYRLALAMGELYHKSLTLADASAICYCWLLLNVEEPSFGWTRTLFIPDPAQGFVPKPSSFQLRVFGAYSRRVRQGMHRVEVKSSNPDLLVTAFAGHQGLATLVILNRSSKAQRTRISWPRCKLSFLEVVDPYHENAVSENPAPSRGSAGDRGLDSQAELLIAPGSIVTLSSVPLGKPQLPVGAKT